jgi:hypothetical protein
VPTRRRIGLIALMIAIAWALVLAGQIPVGRTRNVPAAAPHPIVTQDEFSQLRQGMNYEECVRIIGAPGNPFGSSDAPADHHAQPEWVSYIWRNTPDSFAQISFHHGRAERLASVNLPN